MNEKNDGVGSKIIPKDRREPVDRALLILPPKNAPEDKTGVLRVHTVDLGLRGRKGDKCGFCLDNGV